ncbi:MAG: alanine--glyoxylate aminotransferase family protein [candidate division KSB1 bacterium]|nr:alanine--glyoxylate aminotransferase family protein [candidate division KSB1 bacterium]MDZ7335632.1 alanine--glyoxylate aminotransferase family protein [candidate division KSB1 bacterium]MDZ7358076.1 alanine--glyoxylate aminotransferase family protein [candidate division KSB1 bacterium]MDZ7377138.1 alanine--glyoxylate aminotransferase family protein [candidate division KSB1 bacterium]MDZ7399844.1 alanine--glyoxylate aminotransferase family protein [candidate division KSB1 bacterium]
MGQVTSQRLLLTAGPAPISPEVQEILGRPMVYHRAKEFVELFQRLNQALKYLFQTRYDVVTLTASGTGAMEAVISNLFSPGDAVIVVENGKFSERWTQIATTFGLMVTSLKLPWGKSVELDELQALVSSVPQAKAIFLTHCETSTGAKAELAAIVPALRQQTEALIIVDAISSAGVMPLKMDLWGIDVTITASQKGLGLPPGLSFVALNQRAWRFSELSDLPRYYFDFSRARQALRLGKGSSFTPAIPFIIAAESVLTQIQAQGLEARWQKSGMLAQNFRDRMIATGCTIFPECPADGLTVIKPPNGIFANEIITKLKDRYQIVVSAGQGKLADKVIRIGHFVNVTEAHLDKFLNALQDILNNKN